MMASSYVSDNDAMDVIDSALESGIVTYKMIVHTLGVSANEAKRLLLMHYKNVSAASSTAPAGSCSCYAVFVCVKPNGNVMLVNQDELHDVREKYNASAVQIYSITKDKVKSDNVLYNANRALPDVQAIDISRASGVECDDVKRHDGYNGYVEENVTMDHTEADPEELKSDNADIGSSSKRKSYEKKEPITVAASRKNSNSKSNGVKVTTLFNNAAPTDESNTLDVFAMEERDRANRKERERLRKERLANERLESSNGNTCDQGCSKYNVVKIENGVALSTGPVNISTESSTVANSKSVKANKPVKRRIKQIESSDEEDDQEEEVMIDNEEVESPVSAPPRVTTKRQKVEKRTYVNAKGEMVTEKIVVEEELEEDVIVPPLVTKKPDVNKRADGLKAETTIKKTSQKKGKEGKKQRSLLSFFQKTS